MDSMALLHLLADGQFHSGEELGQALGVSRAAVWKKIQRLQQDTGLAVTSSKGRGYALEAGLELLDPSLIRTALTPRAEALLLSLECHPWIDSTNSRALSLAQQGTEASGTVITAERQIAGRGRRGRAWVSPFGSSVYCSVVWSYEGGASALEGLSLAVGVVIVRALHTLGIVGVQLKWPNDVVWRGRKLAGVLLEMTGDPSGSAQVVVGFGINVRMRHDVESKKIDQPWVDLCEVAGKSPSRNALLAAVLSELLPMLASYQDHGFARWREEWSSHDALQDAPVTALIGSVPLTGHARGVNASGALQLETAGGTELIHGGEVSLRPDDR